MSTENTLARLSLLHLEGDPESLVNMLYCQRLLLDKSTKEDLERQNEWHIKRGNETINIPGYMKDREAVLRSYEESNKDKDEV